MPKIETYEFLYLLSLAPATAWGLFKLVKFVAFGDFPAAGVFESWFICTFLLLLSERIRLAVLRARARAENANSNS